MNWICAFIFIACLPVAADTDEKVSYSYYQELRDIDPYLWDSIGLDQLFPAPPDTTATNQSDTAPEDAPLIDETRPNFFSRQLRSFAAWSTGNGCDAVIWCWCPCVALFIAYKYRDLQYDKFCQECYRDSILSDIGQCLTCGITHVRKCLDQNQDPESQSMDRGNSAPLEELNDQSDPLIAWLDGGRLEHAIMISNPVFHRALQDARNNGRTFRRDAYAVLRITNGQINILTLLDGLNLVPVNVASDGNCLQHALLPEGKRNITLMVKEFTRQTNSLIYLAIVLRQTTDFSVGSEVANTPLHHQLEASRDDFSNSALANVISDDMFFTVNQILLNPALSMSITRASLQDILLTNESGDFSDLSVTHLVPALIGQPLLVIHPEGEDAHAHAYIIDQSGNLYLQEHENFMTLIREAVPIIFNERSHWLTGRLIQESEALAVEKDTSQPPSQQE